MAQPHCVVYDGHTPLQTGPDPAAALAQAWRFADADGRIRATFDIIWLSGWAPHASQQQPLKPGSAGRLQGHGYHKPIMIAGGVGAVSEVHQEKRDLPPGTLLAQLGALVLGGIATQRQQLVCF